jgi:hypothetical protein
MHLPEDGQRSRRNVKTVYGVYSKLSLTCVHLSVSISHLIAQYTVMDHLNLLCTVSAVGRYYPLLAFEILWFYVTTSGCTQFTHFFFQGAAAPRDLHQLRVTL